MTTWRAKHEKFGKVKLLVVGAGGIGCELLKNLAATGFKKVHVIDLDTIDISNLNRQFLFRKEHVKSSKAEIATRVVKQFCPDIDLTFDHASIFDQKFNIDFFRSFDFVLNALDNKNARAHVNRMCLASDRPLIESGTGGYMGQVQVILKGLTECYECNVKPQQKTFPGCTIRNTPSEHIHCTVWSKHVFNQLFGEMDIDDDVSPDVNDPENKGEEEEGEKMEQDNEKEEKKEVISTRQRAEAANYDPEKIFDKLFVQDIEYLWNMKHLWRERRKPISLAFKEALSTSSEGVLTYEEALKDDNSTWSLATCATVFAECVKQLHEQLESNKGVILSFDKDIPVTMAFVAACANIRAHIFNIHPKSLFEIKAMAGNIIPAIAATNAMVAGMMVTEAVKLVHGKLDKFPPLFVRMNPNAKNMLFAADEHRKPNPKCYVCSESREVFVYLNPSEMTVGGLREKVLKKELNMLDPDVMDSENHRIIISSDGDMDAVLSKKLTELEIGDSTVLSCDDFQQDMELRVFIRQSAKLKGEEYEIARVEVEEKKKEEEDSRKRKVDDGETEIPEKKRPKTVIEQDDGIAVVE